MEKIKTLAENVKTFFFGNEGKVINSTYATTVANMSEEKFKLLMSKLNNIHFVNEFKDIIGTNSGFKPTKVGSKMSVEDMLKIAVKCGRLHRLQAWLREAVKEKDRLRQALGMYDINTFEKEPQMPSSPDYLSVEEYCIFKGIDVPTRPRQKVFTKWAEANKISLPEEPTCHEYDTDEILSTYSIKEYEEFIGYNSMAAVLGKLVHDNGPIKAAVNETLKAIANPMSTDGQVITSLESTISEEMVATIIPTFLAAHKKCERAKNGISKTLHNKVKSLQEVENARYREAMNEYTNKISELRKQWSDEFQAANNKYNNLVEEIDKAITDIYINAQNVYNDQLAEYRQQLNERESRYKQFMLDMNKFVEELKIVIPNELLAEFNEIDSELN